MATLRQRGKSTQVCYWVDGKERRVSLKKLVDDLENQREEVSPCTAFNIFTKEYNNWHSKEYPSSNWRVSQIISQYLEPRFSGTLLSKMAKRNVERYKHDRLSTAAVETVKKELRTLQAIMNKAVEWEVIELNPLSGFKMPKSNEDSDPPFYEVDEIVKIYAASNPLHRSIWTLFFNTGMRASEGMNLMWRDVFDDHIVIRSTRDKRTKSGKSRRVPRNNSIDNALKLLDNDGSYVLPRVHVKSLCRAFKTCAVRAKLPGSLHWTRHSYASHLIMNGESIRKVQHLLGHASVSTTEAYSHLSHGYVNSISINL